MMKRYTEDLFDGDQSVYTADDGKVYTVKYCYRGDYIVPLMWYELEAAGC